MDFLKLGLKDLCQVHLPSSQVDMDIQFACQSSSVLFSINWRIMMQSLWILPQRLTQWVMSRFLTSPASSKTRLTLAMEIKWWWGFLLHDWAVYIWTACDVLNIVYIWFSQHWVDLFHLLLLLTLASFYQQHGYTESTCWSSSDPEVVGFEVLAMSFSCLHHFWLNTNLLLCLKKMYYLLPEFIVWIKHKDIFIFQIYISVPICLW